MKAVILPLAGALKIENDLAHDERGYFSRVFESGWLVRLGLSDVFTQESISYNKKKHTLRGLHFQQAPYEEGKIVRCLTGSVYDVMVDLRKGSPTYGVWHAEILSEKKGNAVYIPKGFAHGYQTLEDDTRLYYLISEDYNPEAASGVLWSSERLNIPWPYARPILSDKDAKYAEF